MDINKKEDISYLVMINGIVGEIGAYHISNYYDLWSDLNKIIVNYMLKGIDLEKDYHLVTDYDNLFNDVNIKLLNFFRDEYKKDDMESFHHIYIYMIGKYNNILEKVKKKEEQVLSVRERVHEILELDKINYNIDEIKKNIDEIITTIDNYGRDIEIWVSKIKDGVNKEKKSGRWPPKDMKDMKDMNVFILSLADDVIEERMGGKKHSKREVLGKMMVIYKTKGDRKEYVRHKGKLITIRDYKTLMKQKAKKNSKPKKKKKST